MKAMLNVSNENGFSLIGVLAGASGGLVVILGLMAVMEQVQASGNRTGYRLDVMDAHMELTRAVSGGSFCSCNMKGLTFNGNSIPISLANAAAPPKSPLTVNIPALKIYSADCLGAVPMMSVGQPLNQSSRVSVSSVTLVNPRRFGTTNFLFDLKVELSSPSGPLMPITIPGLQMFTAAAGTNHTVETCEDPETAPLTIGERYLVSCTSVSGVTSSWDALAVDDAMLSRLMPSGQSTWIVQVQGRRVVKAVECLSDAGSGIPQFTGSSFCQMHGNRVDALAPPHDTFTAGRGWNLEKCTVKPVP